MNGPAGTSPGSDAGTSSNADAGDVLHRVAAAAREAAAGDRVVVLEGVLQDAPAPANLLRELFRDPAGPPAALVLDVPNATALSVVAAVVAASAGGPGAASGTPVRRYGLLGLTELLESTGWVVREVHRVPEQDTARLLARGSAEREPAVGAVLAALAGEGGPDRDTARFVVLAHPATEAATLTALRARITGLEADRDRVTIAAAARDAVAQGRIETLARRLGAAAELAIGDRERAATLVAEGATELDEVRAAAEQVRLQLQDRSAELAREHEVVRSVRATREYRTGALVLRAVAPVLAARRTVLQRVRPVLRRLR